MAKGLHELRAGAGLSQRELSARAGVDLSRIKRAEIGTGRLSTEDASALARALSVPFGQRVTATQVFNAAGRVLGARRAIKEASGAGYDEQRINAMRNLVRDRSMPEAITSSAVAALVDQHVAGLRTDMATVAGRARRRLKMPRREAGLVADRLLPRTATGRITAIGGGPS